MKVLIAPDKFKGTLTAEAAAKAIAAGWRKSRPHDEVRLLPMSDGGDGFARIIGRHLGARGRIIRTVDAAHRPLYARWWWNSDKRIAIIESAAVIGFSLLPKKRFHPFELDTGGLAAVIKAAAAAGAEQIIVGLGGSATNDGGFGVARGLGWKFLNQRGRIIQSWTELYGLACIQPPTSRLQIDGMTLAVDVTNPLLGRQGATRIYGPQKGLRSEEFSTAERCLRQLARVARRDLAKDFARQAGAGAAGGLGFGLLTFTGAQLERGFDLFSRLASLDRHLQWADLVITGEGCVDDSSFMGKGAGILAEKCQRLKRDIFAVCGVIKHNARVDNAFLQAHAMSDVTTHASAESKPALWLARLSAIAARDYLGKV